jgi:hypothetical protein
MSFSIAQNTSHVLIVFFSDNTLFTHPVYHHSQKGLFYLVGSSCNLSFFRKACRVTFRLSPDIDDLTNCGTARGGSPYRDN